MKANLVEKKNICVVCGSCDFLTKHHVVPVGFVKHMISGYNRSHDIVLVCANCHKDCEEKLNIFKKDLFIKYDVVVDKEKINDRNKIRRFAYLLLNINLPTDKFEFFHNEILRVLNRSSVSDVELLEIQNSSYINVDDVAIKNLSDKVENNKIAIDFRKHFLECMNPKYLTEGWLITV